MHFLYKPDMLPFHFLDPESDQALDFCLRNLLWSDPEKLRAFMVPTRHRVLILPSLAKAVLNVGCIAVTLR